MGPTNANTVLKQKNPSLPIFLSTAKGRFHVPQFAPGGPRVRSPLPNAVLGNRHGRAAQSEPLPVGKPGRARDSCTPRLTASHQPSHRRPRLVSSVQAITQSPHFLHVSCCDKSLGSPTHQNSLSLDIYIFRWYFFASAINRKNYSHNGEPLVSLIQEMTQSVTTLPEENLTFIEHLQDADTQESSEVGGGISM